MSGSVHQSLFVSVIIATRDRPLMLNECLQHVYAQDYLHFEVIVVDNSDQQDKTLGVVRQFPNLTYIRSDPRQRNPALMRNLGIHASCGDIIAVIDDDTMIAPGWLNTVVEAFQTPQIGGVVGRVIEADAPEVKTEKIGRFSTRGEITMNFNNIIDQAVEVDFLYGCNMAVCKDALRVVGKYDPWIAFAYEEQDLCFRIRKAGFRLLYVPGMVGKHLKSPRPAGVPHRSDSFDFRSLYLSCRSLAYLCVSHFGFRADFARVAFVNIPKGAARAFVDHPSVSTFLKLPAVVLGAVAGYGMAALRRSGLHRPPALI